MLFCDLVSLFLLVVPIMFIPGPSNILSAAAASKYGLRRTVPFVIGMDIMVFVPALLLGFGITSILVSPTILTGFQIIGIAFILFLAWKLWQDEPLVARKSLDGEPGLLEGALVQLANMKGLALLLVVYSQRLHDETSPVRSVIEISLALTVFSLGSHFSWAFGGDWLAKHVNTPRSIRLLNRGYAVLLILTCLVLLAMSMRDSG